jgi:O-antigen/teichoic acid export membrane protein
LFGGRILHVWVGTTVAQAALPVLPIIVWSCSLLGMNVTATYALLALGQVRVVTWLNLIGGMLMLLLMMYLTPRLGIQGIAIARLGYAIVPLFLYIPLLRLLWRKHASCRIVPALQPVGEQS